MNIYGMLLAIGMIICIAAANTENMVALAILAPLGLGLMIMGLNK